MARGRTRKNRRNRRNRRTRNTRKNRKNRRTMKGGLEIWKTSKPTWVKKAPIVENLPKLNISNSRVSTPNSSPNSSPDSSPVSSPKPSVINISFAVPKKQNQKEPNTASGVNPGSRFNLLPLNAAKQMKWFE